MSELTVEELERQAEQGLVVREDVTIFTYRDVDHPDVIRKVCPYCGRVYDHYLLCVSGLIGCRRCAQKRFRERALRWLVSNAPDLVEEATASPIRKLRRLIAKIRK